MTPRDRLLEAAVKSLQENGYARTTTRRIVELAGLHLPAVNYYFGSKERLVQEAIMEAIRRWGQTTIGDAQVTEGPPAAQLRHSLERFLSTLEDDRRYVVAAVEAFAQAERSHELRDRLTGAYKEFRKVVIANIERAAGGDSGRAPREDVRALASTLIALFDGLAIQWLIDPRETPTAEQVLASLAALGQLAGIVEADT